MDAAELCWLGSGMAACYTGGGGGGGELHAQVIDAFADRAATTYEIDAILGAQILNGLLQGDMQLNVGSWTDEYAPWHRVDHYVNPQDVLQTLRRAGKDTWAVDLLLEPSLTDDSDMICPPFCGTRMRLTLPTMHMAAALWKTRFTLSVQLKMDVRSCIRDKRPDLMLPPMHDHSSVELDRYIAAVLDMVVPDIVDDGNDGVRWHFSDEDEEVLLFGIDRQ